MTILEMLEQSGVLTLLGMGIVFGFLVILVISVSLMGKIIQALGAGKNEIPSSMAVAGTTAKSTAVTAAITAAVSEYRKNVEGV
jgi:oxaloacetate decarboxylase gamma subunit